MVECYGCGERFNGEEDTLCSPCFNGEKKYLDVIDDKKDMIDAQDKFQQEVIEILEDDDDEICDWCSEPLLDKFDDPSSQSVLAKGSEEEICDECFHKGRDNGSIQEIDGEYIYE